MYKKGRGGTPSSVRIFANFLGKFVGVLHPPPPQKKNSVRGFFEPFTKNIVSVLPVFRICIRCLLKNVCWPQETLWMEQAKANLLGNLVTPRWDISKFSSLKCKSFLILIIAGSIFCRFFHVRKLLQVCHQMQ